MNVMIFLELDARVDFSVPICEFAQQSHSDAFSELLIMTTHFNPTSIIINAFVKELRQAFESAWGHGYPHHADIISFVGSMALVCIVI
jgi:hypothetical protein